VARPGAQWDWVVVRAASPAFARTLASGLDTPSDTYRYGVENPNLGSGFTSEKLYWVVRETSGRHDEVGPDGVVAESRRLLGPAGGQARSRRTRGAACSGSAAG
jgi:hypothetical protein